MKHFNMFIKSVYRDVYIPFSVMMIIIVFSAVSFVAILSVSGLLAWIGCLIIDKPFLLIYSIEPGLELLLLLTCIAGIINYLRKKWRSTVVN